MTINSADHKRDGAGLFALLGLIPMPSDFVTDPATIHGSRIPADPANFGDDIAWDDHKLAYMAARVMGKDVLDLGCVQHDPENYRSRYWLHRALREKAASILGLDLSRDGVAALSARGLEIVHGDAQNFDLSRSFDVIVAGDLMEHLEDFAGFFTSVKRHLRPGGALLVSTPNPWYWRNIAKAVLRAEVDNNPEHTCWFDPRTLRQLAARHDMSLGEIAFGSRYSRDRLMPLPRGIKHTSWHATLRGG
ncbi:class I SAM-dependent methyltransferase [Qipengyuania marisflavi]|uniref:Class I SAM-dependent methyltransferase n=1 Tax=Qipengyuania marisflavi TaxID=2486356 RepID=A0A5S3P737_9SPHN|nr:class I SAM-dependent methyltransferase [Qipengyuania marisflavi]TMM49043.1 class I SAM-dependent methyltransferase [Qipengyuania marisflavi]